MQGPSAADAANQASPIAFCPISVTIPAGTVKNRGLAGAPSRPELPRPAAPRDHLRADLLAVLTAAR